VIVGVRLQSAGIAVDRGLPFGWGNATQLVDAPYKQSAAALIARHLAV